MGGDFATKRLIKSQQHLPLRMDTSCLWAKMGKPVREMLVGQTKWVNCRTLGKLVEQKCLRKLYFTAIVRATGHNEHLYNTQG